MPGQGGLGSVPEVVAPCPTIRGHVRGASGPGPPSAAASVALLWAGGGGRGKGDRSAPRSVSGARTPGSSGAGGFPDSVAGSRAQPSGKEADAPGRRGRRLSRGAGQGRGHVERPCAFGPCALSVRFYRPMSRSGSPGGLCRGPWPHRPRRPRDRKRRSPWGWTHAVASAGRVLRKRLQGFGGGAGGGAKPSEIKTITPCRLVSSTVFLNN